MTSILVELDSNELILEERRHTMSIIERELSDLAQSQEYCNSILEMSQGDLEGIDNCLNSVDANIGSTQSKLELINSYKHDVNIGLVKVIVPVVVCGVLFGGVGAVFGLIPAVVGIACGLGTGGAVGVAIKKTT